MGDIVGVNEINQIRTLHEQIKTAIQHQHQRIVELLVVGRVVYFMHGSYLQRGEILSTKHSWTADGSIWVRNEKTLVERRVELYDILCAYQEVQQ